jgi:hypothetical protein
MVVILDKRQACNHSATSLPGDVAGKNAAKVFAKARMQKLVPSTRPRLERISF